MHPASRHHILRTRMAIWRSALAVCAVLGGCMARSAEISGIDRVPAGVELSWHSASGTAYTVDTCPDLMSNWNSVVCTTASLDTATWTDTNAVSLRQCFYRVLETNTVRIVQLGDVVSWAYNIQHVDTAQQRDELVGTHFDMYVLEPVVTEQGMSGFDIAGLIRDIRDYNITNYGKRPIILAYVDIGQAEEWRWYWQLGWGVGNPEWIVAGDPNGWDECYPVAYWHPDWKDIVIYGSGGMSHVEAALQAGFDGIYMDWVEAFSDEDVIAAAAGVTNTADAMFTFIEEIRQYARQTSTNANPEFLVVAQNASDLYAEDTNTYERLIDGIALEAIWYDGDGGFDDWSDPTGYNVLTDDIYPGWTDEVLGHLEPMKGRLPIFCAEYAQDVGGASNATHVYTVLAPQHGFVPYCTRRSLGQLSTTPYPHGYTPMDY